MSVSEKEKGGLTNGLATYCLKLPGKRLYLSELLHQKKFRNRGNKAAALAAMHELEAAGIGELEKKESRRGTSAVSTMSVVWKITVIFMCGSAS